MNNENDTDLMERVKAEIEKFHPGVKVIMREVDIKDLPEVDSPSILSELPPTVLDSQEQLDLLNTAHSRAAEFKKTLPPAMVKAAQAGFEKMLRNVYRRGQYSGAMYGSLATAVIFTAAAYLVRFYG